MKQKTFKALEFDKILDMLSEYALSDRAKEKIKRLEPYMEKSEVERCTHETTQAKKIIVFSGTPPLASMAELEKVLALLGKDAMLLPEQLNCVSLFITACNRMKIYLKKAESTYTHVALYGNSINDLSELKDEIERSIKGNMVDEKASAALANIRKKIVRTSDRVKAKLDSILRNNGKYFSESLIVNRNGHFALPVKREYKNCINGTIVDTSRSGGTYFIEPSAVKKMQEELSILHIDEENEVRKILYTLTALVEDYLPLVRVNIEAMETLDFLFAKARLSISMNAVPARLTTGKGIFIKSGRHPLIKADEVVPVDFHIGTGITNGGPARGIIITGPNTGGKTVALKTVGLFSIMAQSGLHVPAEEALFCMHNMVLCDIGDGQSITENLSTFSSHMANIIQILNISNGQSLVLLDELGSGTDPVEGMGIATAILEEMLKKDCLFVATTHYPEIKEFARRSDGLINARMAFDRQNLVPLYKLEIGEAGQSCALYIAKRLGLPQKMIDRAYTVAYSGNGDGENLPAAHYNASDFNKIPHIQKEEKTKDICIQEKKMKNFKMSPKVDKFSIGDSVIVYPQKLTGIVCKKANGKGEFGVQIKGKEVLVNHKRIKLRIPASELYPENYDFSIVFDSVQNRKARREMEKRHNPDLSIEIGEKYDVDG